MPDTSQMIELAKIVAAGIVGAVFAGFFGSFFNLRKFRKEEAWKQKRDAYNSIVFELGREKANARSLLEHYVTNGALSATEIKRPLGVQSLTEISISDDYIVSKNTARALAQFIFATEQPHFQADEWADAVVDNVDEAIRIVRLESVIDLKLLSWTSRQRLRLNQQWTRLRLWLRGPKPAKTE